MSKRQFKPQASSSRAVPGTSGAGFGPTVFGSAAPTGFGASTSPLSYITEPPNLSSISDPHVVVAFKNLAKKDSTTKAKALEDLQAYVSSSEVEEAVLEAWVKTYPRTSIDTDRRVRQLAHTLNGQISVSCGKRVAKFMPQIVGSWLAGSYDNDRSVARAAQDSLQQVFPTPEKLQNVRKAYQPPILEYCRNAIVDETPQTLSDERSVSPDDAAAKYTRVIATSIAVVTSLLTELKSEDIAKQQSLYDGLVQSSKLWEFASYSDTAVRRAVHRLLKTLMSSQRDVVSSHLDTLSTSYIFKGLNSDQSGSSYDYTEALLAVTAAFPSVWTDHYKGKKSVAHRLRQFLKNGSQGGPSGFWDNVAKLVQKIPRSALGDADDAIELLSAMRNGINRREELRANVATAFNTYVDVAAALSVSLAEEDQRKLANEALLPLLSQFIKPAAEHSDWTIPGPQGMAIISRAMRMSSVVPLLESEWKRISTQLIEDVKTSLPEQSKDFDKSQKTISDEGLRWASIQCEILTKAKSSELWPVFSQSSCHVIRECLEVLRTRNGKPYGAASVVDSVVRQLGGDFFGNKESSELVATFVRQDLPNLFLSPSCSKLASLLYAFHKQDWFKDAWTQTVQTVLDSSDSSAKSSALQELLAPLHVPKDFRLAASSPELQSYLIEQSNLAIQGSSDWSVITHALKSSANVLAPATTEDILANMTAALAIEDKAPSALHGFGEISKQNATVLKEFMSTPEGSKLLPKLLFLAESSDEDVAHTASDLNGLIQSTMLQGGSGSQQTMFEVIQNGLNEAAANSVSVQTLVDLAKGLLMQVTSAEERRPIVERLLPDPTRWDEALERHLQLAPRPALAITNPLGGGVHLVSSEAKESNVSTDADGYSTALRMAMYTVKIIKDTDIYKHMAAHQRAGVLRELMLSVQLANDNLGLAGSNSLWIVSTPEVENEILDSVSDAQGLINEWLRGCDNWSSNETQFSDYGFVKSVVDRFLRDASGKSASAFYNARAYSVVVAELVEMHGWQKKDEEQMESQLKSLRRSKDVLATIAFLTGLRVPLSRTKYVSRLCNELVADLTGLNIGMKPDEGLQLVVLLDTIIQVQNTAETIAKQRLIFFVKHVIPWLQLQETPVSLPIQSETCQVLSAVLSYMNDIYGSHWTDILAYLTGLWSGTTSLGTSRNDPLPALHASLRLLEVLRRLKSNEDVNDDLLDAWKEAEGGVSRGLLNLLKQARDVPDEYHQPMMVVNELLARQISHLSLERIENPGEIFPLLYVESRPVQQIAFNILHRQIPAAQEQISFDAALDKKDAHLPEELLSLILEAPAAADLAETSFERTTPSHLRGYLYSWLLVFDHFENSSYKVKTDYIANIKDGGYVVGLLDFASDFLGHGRGKPVDVSKFDITTYNPDELDSPLKDTQWLLTHLYYLCLRHIPSLVKAWWIDCKSRQKVISVESWTEKHISPPIISAALATVAAWYASTSSDPEHANLTVRVSPRARELTASYLVDEQPMTMRVALPPAYPLRPAAVDGLARVAVPDAKWQAWLRNAQAVIAFSDGSLVDGLTAWRRNVAGALRGQTECAICYSIVGADKSLPSKRCSTCKNSFHGGCLFRWFKTSNGSSCPLCRNPFNYG